MPPDTNILVEERFRGKWYSRMTKMRVVKGEGGWESEDGEDLN